MIDAYVAGLSLSTGGCTGWGGGYIGIGISRTPTNGHLGRYNVKCGTGKMRWHGWKRRLAYYFAWIHQTWRVFVELRIQATFVL